MFCNMQKRENYIQGKTIIDFALCLPRLIYQQLNFAYIDAFPKYALIISKHCTYNNVMTLL